MNELISSKISRSCLKDMIGGWFIGAFSPAAYVTADIEVAVQYFPACYKCAPHHHKVATEVTLLLSGEAILGGEHLKSGDILTLAPGTSTTFEALTDCVTVVVKHPGILNDKYSDEEVPLC